MAAKRKAEDVTGEPEGKKFKARDDWSVGTTVNEFIRTVEHAHPEATGKLTSVLMEICVTCKLIASKMQRAGIADILGKVASSNSTGDVQAKLDVQTNQCMVDRLVSTGKVCAFISEEEENVMYPPGGHLGRYIVASDPLDGSSNIDCNVPVGTIFGVWLRKTPEGTEVTEDDIMRPGKEMAASGYVIYGSSVMLVLSMGRGTGVQGFTLDPSIGEFVLSHPNIVFPATVKCFSINEGNFSYWSKALQAYVAWTKEEDKATKRPYSGRYVGSLVSDFHRNLLYGGIYCYPGDTKNKSGKLRLMYECAPLSFLAHEAGGKGSDGRTDILEIVPRSIHQKTPLFIGNLSEVERVEAALAAEAGPAPPA